MYVKETVQLMHYQLGTFLIHLQASISNFQNDKKENRTPLLVSQLLRCQLLQS